MREKMKKWISFMTFDLTLDTDNIGAEFAAKHSRQQKEFPQWSTTATRQKMIAEYWYSHVVRHYLLLLVVPILLVCFLYRHLPPAFLIVIAAAIVISFPVLLLFNYSPNFSGHFLPKLESVKEIYEQKQQEKMEKCRKLQLSNFALTLVFYVFDQTSAINSLQPSDKFAGILAKLYGVDRGSLKSNLEIIVGNSSQRKNPTGRMHTEIENRFKEAYQFFDELDFPAGTQLLQTLEAKRFMK